MIVFDSGSYLESNLVTVSPLSEAFLYGRMSFTTLLGWNGRFLGLDLHLRRLLHMAQQEGGALSLELSQLQAVLEELCQKNAIKDWARARVMIWKEPDWRILIEVSAFSRASIDQKRRDGVVLGLNRADLCIDPWGYSSCKGYGYMTRLRAAQAQVGCEDSLWIDDLGRVGECGTCTPIYFNRDRFYINQREGLLKSVTADLARQSLFGLGWELIDCEIDEEFVRQSESIFIASSLRWILPVREIRDFKNYGVNSRAWNVLLEIQKQWQQSLQIDCKMELFES